MSKQSLVGALAVVAVLAMLSGTYAIGQSWNRAARIELNRTIASESQDFCNRYRAVNASDSIARCIDELLVLRRRHEQRINDIFYPGID